MRGQRLRLFAMAAAAVAACCTLGGGAGAATPWNFTNPTVFAPSCLTPLHRSIRHCLDPASVWGVTISGSTHTIDPSLSLKYEFSVHTPKACPAKLRPGIVCTVSVDWGIGFGASLADWGLLPTEALNIRPYAGCNGNDRSCDFTVALNPRFPTPLVKGTALRVTAVAQVIGLNCGHGPGWCNHWVDWRLRLGTRAESLGIDWKMPSRLYPDNSDWGGQFGLPPASYANPSSWQVDLFLTTDGIKTCPAGSTFDWTVSRDGTTDTLDSHGCTATADVPKLGVYSVTAKELKGGAPTGTEVTNADVVIRDWLIVGLGDSNGSGQGNPPYLNDRCDRSEVSYQYQTALYIEHHDPRSSVTFVFDACSGARSDQVWQNGYEGQEPTGGPLLPAQLDQVERVIGDRKPDAVIMSVGINDLYFGAIMGFCATYSPGSNVHGQRPGPAACEDAHVTPTQDDQGYTTGYTFSTDAGDATLASRTAARLEVLPNRLSLLAQHLDGLGAAHVFATQYPDETTNAHGQTCDNTGPFPKLSAGVWGWLHEVGADLNSVVGDTSSLGWTPITGVAAGFVGHGYCSGDSYFDTPAQSVWEQHNAYGSFHATAKGATITYTLTRNKVCEALYGNAGCEGLPPPPR